MIDRLKIVGFQAHENLRIDPDAAVTVIVGQTDVGKSSIMRAIEWLCTNRPLGDAFIRHGCDFAEVRARVDDVIVSRVRTSAGVNVYRIDDKEFKAFSTEPPEPVKKLFNLGPASFSRQHDPVFWLSLSPGELAKELNRIADLSVIDKALELASQHVRRARAAIEVSQKRLDKAAETVASLSFATDLSRDYSNLVSVAKQALAATAQSELLAKKIESVRAADMTIHTADEIGRAFDALREPKPSRATPLAVAIGKANRLVAEVKEKQAQAAAATLELKNNMGGKCPLCERPL